MDLSSVTKKVDTNLDSARDKQKQEELEKMKQEVIEKNKEIQ